MFPEDIAELPIYEILDEITTRLHDSHELVLQAPPGAGKTTVVPLALLEQSWLAGRKILVLEPRRMAARAAASRMAELLGESVGQTVGYRIRLDTCVTDQTRIEVITEGILTRRLQSDPGLEDVGLVIFDEFHERNLDSDLCLAMLLQGRELYRDGSPLKLLVMSATLDADAVAGLIGAAPPLTSEGRQFPVESFYCQLHRVRDPIAPVAAQTVLRTLQEHEGSVLVFLPGQREINQVARQLGAALQEDGLEGGQEVLIMPLYGSLSLQRQQQALRPAPSGQRKVVLSTNLAETSVTIEGIEVVVDSGLVREAVFDPATSTTRLVTRRVSRASAEQRQGRAGRLSPGTCYRLWSKEQDQRLVAQTTPEILQADLAPLALQLLAWGVKDPAELAWLDQPPAAAYQQALSMLEVCDAIYRNESDSYRLTPQGVRLAQMPLHPRLGHMLLVGCDIRAMETACLLAAVLSERNPLAGKSIDINLSLAVLMGQNPCPPEQHGWFKRIWQQSGRFARLGLDGETQTQGKAAIGVTQERVIGVLLASAYPDRIARLRQGGDGTQYQLSNGRSAVLPAADELVGQPWLAVADIGGHDGESADRIFSASALDPASFSEILSPLVREQDQVEWNYRTEQLVAERHKLVGRIQLSAEPLVEVPEADRSAALLGVVRKKGLDILPWTPKLRQWQARVMLLHRINSDSPESRWPDLSDEGLLAQLEDWLLPFLGQVRRLQDFQALDLKAILQVRLPWPMSLDLERLAPDRLAVPSGSSVAIDYTQDPPVLAVKLQEMFGCEETPTVAGGLVPLVLHLLSPAGRPAQITQDLSGFWQNGYEEVKREMKGRYPKHPWPDDPLQALATRHTKKRMGGEF